MSCVIFDFDMTRLGHFVCSSLLENRTYHSVRDNLQSTVRLKFSNAQKFRINCRLQSLVPHSFSSTLVTDTAF